MSNDTRSDIRSLSREDLEQFMVHHALPKYKGVQVFDWLWKKGCQTFGGMTTLSKSDRKLLSESFTFRVASLLSTDESLDGTVKMAFQTADQLVAEGVLIPSAGRNTACISSQVGCALGCTFCATGGLGFTRNLTSGEIFDQVVHISAMAARAKKQSKGRDPESDQTPVHAVETGHTLSNIVFMGMGEPLLNYQNVKTAIGKLTAPDGMNFSPQRITLSTVGIPKMIRTLADDDPKYHLALSLHAATDSKRDILVPVNRKFPLSELILSLKYFHQKTGKRITIEYILFHDFNDTIADARDLARFCKHIPVKINLIEYNQVRDTGYKRSTAERVKVFAEQLERFNLVVNIRKSRGEDINAACGQLAGALKNKQVDTESENRTD